MEKLETRTCTREETTHHFYCDDCNKYLGKTEERIVYSKDLPTYFISDIMDEDIVCTIGIEDRKLLLFDDFKCWDEGVYVGKVSKETISQLRKAN